MKKIFYFFFLILIFGCGNSEHKKGDGTDKEREALLREKKERLTEKRQETIVSNVEWGSIRFSPYVPPYPELGREGVENIENKLNSLISKYGASGSIGNPSFVIIPAISVTSSNATTTAPVLYANKYSVTFYTANLLDGTIFSSAIFKIKGVGETPLKAFLNGFEAADFDGERFKLLLSEGKQKAIHYYEANCSSILQQAKTEASQKNYQSALLILKTIPKEVACYTSGTDLINTYFKLYNGENCTQLLSKMKAELGKQSEIGGFNENAMTYFSLIPAEAPCYKEAQNTYSAYIKKLNPDAKQKWIVEEREFNLRKDKQESDHSYEMAKSELESKVAIDGQSALLDKYKKDHEYNKLPWLRKLIHFGEWDPFDATSKLNK